MRLTKIYLNYSIIIIIIIFVCIIFLNNEHFESYESFDEKYNSKSVIIQDPAYRQKYTVYCGIFDSNMKETISYFQKLYPTLIFRNWSIQNHNVKKFLSPSSIFILPQFLNNKLNKKYKFVANLFLEEISFIVQKGSSYKTWNDILTTTKKFKIGYYENHYGSELLKNIYKYHILSNVKNTSIELVPLTLYQKLGDMWEEKTIDCIYIYSTHPLPFIHQLNEIVPIYFLDIKMLYIKYLQYYYPYIKHIKKRTVGTVKTRSSSKIRPNVPFFKNQYMNIDLNDSYGFYVNMFANENISNCVIYNIIHTWINNLHMTKINNVWTRSNDIYEMSDIMDRIKYHDGAYEYYNNFFEKERNLHKA